MCLELTENARKLFDMLFTTDFNRSELKAKLDAGLFSVDDVNMAAFRYVEYCNGVPDFDECDRHPFGEIIPGYESSHLLEAIKLLLEYGLDPNKTFDTECHENILSELRFVMNGYQSADAAALMFERGADPNLTVDGGENTIIGDLCFDVCWFLYGDVDSRYVADEFMHYWMVIIGNGAKFQDGSEVVKVFQDHSAIHNEMFDVSKLKNHRQYYFGIVNGGEKEHSWVSIFDKATSREVARYE